MSEIKRAKVTLSTDDKGEFPLHQISYFGKVKLTETIFPYGISARPPKDALTICFPVGGSEEDLPCIAYAPNTRFKNLLEGEFAVGNQLRGNSIYFRDNGVNEINGGDYGGVIKIDDLTAKINDFVSKFNAHKHPETGSTTGVPTSSANSFSKTDYENLKVQHGKGGFGSGAGGGGGSGAGILSLNGLTAQAQTLVAGSAGVDFNISSVGSVHNFNLPTASAINRGALSAADWVYFNAKWDDLQQVVRVAKSGGDFTTIAAANNSISDNANNKRYSVLIGPGAYNETCVAKPFVNYIGIGGRLNTFVNAFNVNFTGATDEYTEIVGLGIGDIVVNFQNGSYTKELEMRDVLNYGSITAQGENNEIHYVAFETSQPFAPITLNGGVFFLTEYSSLANPIILNSDSVWQHLNGEVFTDITLNNTSQAFIRGNGVAAFPLLSTSRIYINDDAILNIDANSIATQRIIRGAGVTDAQIQILTGISAGVISPTPTFVNNLDGTITMAEAQVFIYDNDHQFGLPRRFIVPSKILTLTDLVNNYVEIRYNAGTPEYINGVTKTSNDSDIVPVITIFRDGTELHETGWDALGEGLSNKIHQRIVDTEPFALKSGLALGELPTRIITIDAGYGYNGAVPFSFDACNSSVANTHWFYYYNGASWVKDMTKTQYNNSQYQGPTGLVSALPNKYLINFIFRGLETDGHVYSILGTQEYAGTAAGLVAAQEAQIPANLPPIIISHTFLVGKIIVLTAATTATSIQSAFTKKFTSSPATDHGALSGLGDDDHLQYLPLSGIRAMTGNLNMGEYNIGYCGDIFHDDATASDWVFRNYDKDKDINFYINDGGIDSLALRIEGLYNRITASGAIASRNGVGGVDCIQILMESNLAVVRATTFGGGTYRPLVLRTSDVNRVYITTSGKIGIAGLTSPGAYLHFAAGTAVANNAPLKFTSGVNLTAPEAGAMEYDNAFYLTPSTGTRYKIPLIAGTDYLTDVVQDTTPQLGGDLDTNSSDIKFLDNDKAIFGTGLDGEVYSDGDNLVVRGLTSGKIIKVFQNIGGLDTEILRTGILGQIGLGVDGGNFEAALDTVSLGYGTAIWRAQDKTTRVPLLDLSQGGAGNCNFVFYDKFGQVSVLLNAGSPSAGNSNFSGSLGIGTRNNSTSRAKLMVTGDRGIECVDLTSPTFGSEVLTNGALTGGTSWSASGDCTLTGNNAVFAYSSGATSYFEQTAANFATPATASTWHKFTIVISGATSAARGFPVLNIHTTFSVMQFVAVDGTQTWYVKSNLATPTSFRITTTLFSGQGCTVESVSLLPITSGGLFTGGGLTGLIINPDGSGIMAGAVTSTQFKLSALNTAPANASDTGTLGEIRIVDGYIYICTATNTWKRVAVATW